MIDLSSGAQLHKLYDAQPSTKAEKKWLKHPNKENTKEYQVEQLLHRFTEEIADKLENLWKESIEFRTERKKKNLSLT